MAFEHGIRVIRGACDPGRIVHAGRLCWCVLDPINARMDPHPGDTAIRFRVKGRQDGHRCITGDFVNVFVDPAAFRKRSPHDEVPAVGTRHLRPE